MRVCFTPATKTNEQALASIREALGGEVKDWQVPYGAASFAFTANLDNKAEAMKWVDQSINLKKTFRNLRLKAQMQEKDGKIYEAIATGEEAVKVGKENKDEPGEVAKTE